MTANPLSRYDKPPGFTGTLRRHWALWLIVAALAALVRALVLAQVLQSPFGGQLIMDAAGYQRWSLDIAAGHWLGDGVFYQEPLYPYLLGVIHLLFGDGLRPVLAVQLAAGVVTCVLTGMLAARVVASRWAGLIAGLVLAFYGPMVFYEAQVLKVVWAALLIVALAHLLISAWERPRLWLFAVSGAALGLLALVRGNALVAVPFVLLWVALAERGRGAKRAFAAAALVVVGLALPLGVVMARNALVGGEFVLSSSHAGFNFYIGNHQSADGTYMYVEGVREDPRFEGADARALASRRMKRELSYAESSDYWFAEAFAFMRKDPASWLALQVKKLARFFNAEEIQDTWSPAFFKLRGIRALSLAFLTYGMLAPAALAGAVMLWRRGMRLHLVNLMAVSLVLSVVIFYVFGRYRMPVVPLFAVLAAGAVVTFARWVKAGAWAWCAAAALGVVAASLVVNMTLVKRYPASLYRAGEYHNLGILEEQAGHVDAARQAYDSALRVYPAYARSRTALANIYRREGKLDSAKGLLFEALKDNPNDAEAHYLLGAIRYGEGRIDEAILELRAAVRAQPAFLEARRDLGAIYLQRREWRLAAVELEAAARLDENSETVWHNLGGCRFQLKEYAKAREAWERALALAETDEKRKMIRKDLDRLPKEETP